MVQEIQFLSDGFVAEIADVDAAHRHCQAGGGKPLSPAGVAGDGAHIRFDFLFDPVALGIAETPFQIVDDPFELRFIMAVAVFAGPFQLDLLPLRPVQDDIENFGRKLAHRGIQGKMIVLRQPLQVHGGDAAPFHGPSARLEPALVDGKALVRQDQVRVDLHENPEAGAFGTCAVGVVEREHARRQFFDAGPVLRAGVILGKGDVLAVHHADDDKAARKPGGRFDRIRQAGADVRMDHETVHHDFDRMFFVLFQLDGLRQIVDVPIYAHPHEPALAGGVELLGVLALARPHHRGKDLDFAVFGQGEHPVHDLVDRLLLDFAPADRAVRNPDPRVKQAQVIINFRDRPDRGTRIFRRRLLIDGNGRGKPLDIIHIRLFHLAQKLPRIGGKGFHIAAAPLRVNGVERKRGLSRAGKPRQNHQFIARYFNVDIF